MALGIVSGTEVDTPAQAVQMNAQSFRESALVRGQVGAAAGEAVSGFFGEVAQKFQQNRNAQTVLDADLKMRKFTDDYRDSLAKNPDEMTWLPGFQNQATQLRESILNGHNVGPDVRNQLTAMIDRWQTSAGSEIKTAAQLQQLNRTKQTAIADYTYASRQGDEAGAYAAIQLGQDNHALFPEDADRMRREVPQIAQRAQVDTGIINDPIATLELLKDQTEDGHSKRFPAIDPRTLQTLVTTTRNAVRKVQIENAQGLSAEMDDAIDHRLDPRALTAARDAKQISPYDYERLALRMKNYEKAGTAEHAKEESAQFNLALMEADTPPTDARDLPKWAAEMKQNGLQWTNPAYRRRLNEFVDRKVSLIEKEGKTHERPVETRIYGQMRKDFEEGFTLPGAPIMEDVPGTGFLGIGKQKRPAGIAPQPDSIRYQWEAKASEKERNAANFHYAQQLEQMRGWFKEHPDATDTEAEEFRQKISQPYVMDAVKRSLGKFSPERPANAAFFSKSTGKWYDKDKREIP